MEEYDSILIDKDFDPDNPNDQAKAKLLLYFVVQNIIDELPESQRTFYQDLFGGNLNQADVAKLYGITPQAVTNRLSKLKKAVRTKLKDQYGLEEDMILKIVNFRDGMQLLADQMEQERRTY